MVDLDALRDHGLRVLHEAMYGAGAGLIARALDGGSTTVEELHGERNPGFGGMHPEPIDRYMPEAMERMQSGDFDLGIANDGDADRVGIIDETGRYINQLQVMALFAMYLLEKRGLRGDIVRSITTSGMLDAAGRALRCHRARDAGRLQVHRHQDDGDRRNARRRGIWWLRVPGPHPRARRHPVRADDGLDDRRLRSAALRDPRPPRGPGRPARVRPPRHSLSARRLRGAQGADLRAHAAERARQPRREQGGAHPHRRRVTSSTWTTVRGC